MSHKSAEQQARGFRRYALLGGLVLATVATVGIGSMVQRGNNSDAAKGWPDATATASLNPEAPYLASPETPKQGEIHKGMEKSIDPGLKAISAVEKQTGYRFNSNMFFTGMPCNPEDARQQADEMAKRLKEYSKYGVKPQVVMEPTTTDKDGKQQFLDLTTMTDAKHVDGFRQTMNEYFARLQESGVTDEQMGTWTPLPEPNVPEWAKGNTDPETFKRNFTEISQAMKTHFRQPEAKVSMMLDSATYPSGKWDNPSYDAESLKRYTSGIPDGLVSTFGFQGMPYNPSDDPNVFLNPDIAAEVANSLNVKEVWLNTGSFGSYTDVVTGQRATTTSAERGNMLFAEGQTAATLQQSGFDVSVNIFAESAAAPNPDWAYKTSSDQQMLNGTLNAASAAPIPLPVSMYITG